jgi:hypothetical protein
MAAVSLEKFQKMEPSEKLSVLEQMKKDMGVDGILKQWKISRSKYYKIKNGLNVSLASADSLADTDTYMNTENILTDDPNSNIEEQKFSFTMNMVGSLDPLTSTMELLNQSQLISSASMRISVHIQEI